MLRAVEMLEEVSEAAVVAAFLRAELESSRYGAMVRMHLAHAGATVGLVEAPNLDDERENETRAFVLGAYRGWPDQLLFRGFPRTVLWRRATASASEVGAFLYINDDPALPGREGWSRDSWFGLSGGTRHVADGAARVKRGRPNPGYEEVFGSILAIADRMRNGATYPELILARQSADSPLHIVEGHTRATAYVVARRERVPVFIGDTTDLGEWHLS